ncbi:MULTISPECIES: hypothetical protein [unclassified Lentimonas]|uniref:hypothetical protein n=1 Tax=unclassified Lentimonas TaxID=2630993 RepID=UPI0013251E50|nr:MULTISPECIES: hypothetical protein [unclassified Lentimonas]CAA6676334.1 Unannotated [Lentimonas sp. CC4]CAA6683776.1 Unannotated [Lentimonas sp. CC6]CAA7077829.1 Unannotated [Lentimonas sp. CC4]CAA7169759.1 Unannotated [Lentimonas sp. CC21]CAA7179877.1 Unannotated [Lentimonas sp. CC8]
MKKMLTHFLFLLALTPLSVFADNSGEISLISGQTIILTGKVMDTDDNWLNDVKVSMNPVDTVTTSDPNGDFTFEFVYDEKIKPNKRGILATLTFEKEGHVDEKIRIRSTDFFIKGKPLVVKLKSEPMQEGMVGFTAQMVSVNAVGKETSGEAEFHVYIPESVEKVRAAFYLSRHGMGDITPPILQKFAEEEKVALIGMYGNPVQRGLSDVSLTDEHVKKLAELSGHPELVDAPILTFGHSNGTGFAACWPAQRPEKAIGWISFHPGFTQYLEFPNTETVPAMVMLGTVDEYFLRSRQDETVKAMRKTRDAAMCTMMEAGVGHGPVDPDIVWDFVVEFCKAAMRVRLGEDGELKPIKIEDGWLGATYDVDAGGRQLLEIAPYAEFKGDQSTANWLMDEEFAKVWQAYARTDHLKKK